MDARLRFRVMAGSISGSWGSTDESLCCRVFTITNGHSVGPRSAAAASEDHTGGFYRAVMTDRDRKPNTKPQVNPSQIIMLVKWSMLVARESEKPSLVFRETH